MNNDPSDCISSEEVYNASENDSDDGGGGGGGDVFGDLIDHDYADCLKQLLHKKHTATSTTMTLLNNYPTTSNENGNSNIINDLFLMHRAASVGSCNVAAVLLDYGFDINQRNDDNGSTPLHCAIRRRCTINPVYNSNDQHNVEWYLLHGSDVEAEDDAGLTPLLLSISLGHFNYCKYLLRYGSDMHHKTRNGKDAIDLLFDLNDKASSATIMRYLLQFGFNPNSKDSNGETPLHKATRTGSFHVVDVLIGKDTVGLYEKDRNGNTALHLSVLYDYPLITEALVNEMLNRRLHLVSINCDGDMATHIAARLGREECMKAIINNDAFLGKLNNNGLSPLGEARLQRRTSIIKLLEHEFDLHLCKNSNNWSAVNVLAEMDKWQQHWDEEKQGICWKQNVEGETLISFKPPSIDPHKLIQRRESSAEEWIRK